MKNFKAAPLKVKAAGPDDGMEEGQFQAYISVFGNTDSYGDIVQKGAFTRTLGEWAEKGNTIPVLWGHDMNDPFANIGGVLSAEEDDYGLKVTAQLDLENPTAAQVYRLAKGRRTTSCSFAYSVRDGEKKDDGFHLKDLDLYEVSIVQVPANELAEITMVKDATAALAKAGRVLSAKNEQSLREARDSIDSVLTSLAGDQDGKAADAATDEKAGTVYVDVVSRIVEHSQGEQASGEPEAKSGASDEEPHEAKSSVPDEEPKAGPSVEDLAAQATIYALKGQEGILL